MPPTVRLSTKRVACGGRGEWPDESVDCLQKTKVRRKNDSLQFQEVVNFSEVIFRLVRVILRARKRIIEAEYSQFCRCM